jgi:2-dehydro-3-deoxygluconokinase
MKKVVTFGEIMLRLTPPGFQRLQQTRRFEANYGGGEANVAVSLAQFGREVEFVTRLPENDLGAACLASLRAHGVGTAHIVRGGNRLGVYFLEIGAAHRGYHVLYDRADSSFATLEPGLIDWESVFAGAGWFHWTGITLAVSAGAAGACREAIAVAKRLGLTVSCDPSYRHKLWQWGRAAVEVMPDLIRQCDVIIAGPEDAERVFGFTTPVLHNAVDGHRAFVERLAQNFPNLQLAATTLRGAESASHQQWSGTIWRNGQFHAGPTYDILPVIDRIGAGDAFAAGLIYALSLRPDDLVYALNFALAASCLKHSIVGDANLVSVAEVEQLMAGETAGRVSR